MKAFTKPLEALEFSLRVQSDLEKGIVPVHVGECIDSQKSHFIYSLRGKYKRCLVVASDDTKAKEIYEDYRFFDKSVCLYPGKDVIFYSADIRGNLILKQRMAVVKRMIEGEDLTVVTSINALMDRVTPVGYFAAECHKSLRGGSSVHRRPGEKIDTSWI